MLTSEKQQWREVDLVLYWHWRTMSGQCRSDNVLFMAPLSAKNQAECLWFESFCWESQFICESFSLNDKVVLACLGRNGPKPHLACLLSNFRKREPSTTRSTSGCCREKYYLLCQERQTPENCERKFRVLSLSSVGKNSNLMVQKSNLDYLFFSHLTKASFKKPAVNL